MKPNRLNSLDALRGFTMFWIIGGGALVHSAARSTTWPVFQWFSNQLVHVKWNGFHFLDLVFPLFMFVAGVAVPFSIGEKLIQGINKNKLLAKVAKRALILILLGIIYNNKISFDFANLRYASVLGQIGVAYFIAVAIYLHTGIRGQFIWTVVIMIGFWAVMVLIPVPGVGAGVLTPEGNFSGYIDRLLLPGATYREYYDPQGILLMISAATISLMGIITGTLLKNENYPPSKKMMIMFSGGALFVVIALIWSIWYPINKEIWSGPFDALTIGLSIIFMAVFYFIIDVKGKSGWAFPFVIIGLNSITIYMLNRMVDFQYTADFLLKGMLNITGNYASVILNVGVILLQWFLLYFLYKKRVFLKV